MRSGRPPSLRGMKSRKPLRSSNRTRARPFTHRTRSPSSRPTKPTRSAPPSSPIATHFSRASRNATSASAAKYVDGISFNCYQFDPRKTIERYSVFGKPLIIGEFSFRGQDVGLPNSKGGGERVKTQADRAAAYKNFVTWGLESPYLVGYHWFEHCDEPKEGRFDGENCNYGVVNIKDEVYAELTRAMTEINAQAEALHGGSK